LRCATCRHRGARKNFRKQGAGIEIISYWAGILTRPLRVASLARRTGPSPGRRRQTFAGCGWICTGCC